MSEEFDLSWLDLREPFDAFARSEALAAALIARLPARPRLIDLGAGTGSLLRWLAPRIGRAQVWTLVDSSREMAEAAFDTFADRAELMGYKVTAPCKRTLLVHAPGGAWRIEALIADLAESPANLPLQAADAVVSSALCDLVSRAWLERMAAALRGTAGRFLTELVLGHAEAAGRQDRRGDTRIEAWMDARLDQVAGKRLAARIGHRDVLALPGRR